MTEATTGAGGDRRRPRRWMVAVGGVVLLVAGAAVWAVTRPAALPEPRALARDPVPPVRYVTAVPRGCGITPGTLAALVPHARRMTGDRYAVCEWHSAAGPRRGNRRLTIDPSVSRRRYGEAFAVDAAFDWYAQLTRPEVGERPDEPLAGLGTEAAVAPPVPAFGGGTGLRLAVRVGTLAAYVQYDAGTRAGDGHRVAALPTADLRAAAARAAGDLARALGAPAHPRPAPPPPRPPAVRLPRSACGTVPTALRDRLVGPGASAEPGGVDPSVAKAMGKPPSADCQWVSRDATLDLSVTVPDDPYRAYLRSYEVARAAKGYGRSFFHALAGLGDQAYETDAPYPRIVARAGGALVEVAYPGLGPSGISARDGIDGSYAVAVAAVRRLRG